MIRTKYKVLVPLVEYYEKEDAKKLEEVAISFNKSIINHDIIRTLKKKGCKTSKELQSLPES